MYAEVNHWHHRQLAYLLGRLQSVKEPAGGTLLDSTLLVYGSSLGDGHEHDNKDLPTLIAGGGAMGVKTGREIKKGELPSLCSLHSAALSTVVGKEMSFGSADKPMAGLLKS